MKRPLALAAVAALGLTAVGCGSDGSSGTPAAITLVAYDSFPPKKTSLNTALDNFTKATGIAVKIVIAGDAGTMVTKAKLTAGNPEGDVMWGVDNTLLFAVLDGKVFSQYEPNGWNVISTDLTALVPGERSDTGRLRRRLHQLRHRLVHDAQRRPAAQSRRPDEAHVQGPARRREPLDLVTRPGVPDGHHRPFRSRRLEGLLEGAARQRSGGRRRLDHGVRGRVQRRSRVTGSRPLVVSYGSSPPAEVIFADPPRTDAPTAVVESTCFRQVEFAGVLRGTKHETEARKLVDFLIVRPSRTNCR